jgi:osmotically-inducible protein OsmY
MFSGAPLFAERKSPARRCAREPRRTKMANSSRSFALLTLSLGAAAAVACNKPVPEPVPTKVPPAPSAATSATAAAEPTVEQAVRQALLRDEHLAKASLKVTVKDGAVELAGESDNPISRARAALVAGAVRGVRSVKNGLEVKPAPRSDADIEKDARVALEDTAATAPLAVHVAVKDKVATLTGTIASRPLAELALRVVSGVRGVRDAADQLQLKPSATRDAKALEADIKDRFAWDAWLEHDQLTASVKDGRVTLAGTVGSLVERERAVRDARAAGASAVDAAGVAIQPRTDASPKVAGALTDDRIATAVKTLAQADPRTRAERLDVSVQHGRAILTGAVATLEGKRALGELAAGVIGVTNVENRVDLLTPRAETDASVRQRIEQLLALDALVDGKAVKVAVDAGRVTLSGSVRTFFDAAEAADVASRVSGVSKVESQLTPSDQAVSYVHVAWLDPYEPRIDSDYLAPSHALVSDGEVERRISSEYAQSPFVFPTDVKVRVSNGRATLTGTARSHRERDAAEDVAIQAGAIQVDNQLKLG